MLNVKYRLKKRKTFNYIYKNGRNVGCEFLTLVFCFAKMPQFPHIKVGFSASKKVGNSVQRHRAVRMMREGVKPFLDKFKHNHNYIFVAKESILEKTLAEIKKSCQYVLQKGGLLNG
jgi:ribonuclease P protein component